MWHGLWSGPCAIGWTVEPEQLLFYARTPEGNAIVAGNPGDGSLTRIAHAAGIGRLRFVDGDRLVVNQFGVPKIVPIGTDVVEVHLGQGGRAAASLGVHVLEDEGVTLNGAFVIAQRNLSYELAPSPSGQWIAVAQRPKSYTHAFFRISSDLTRVTVLKDSEYDVFGVGPSLEQNGSSVSPDGRWRALIDSDIRIVRDDGLVVEVDSLWMRWDEQSAEESVVWAPGSDSFAFVTSSSGSVGEGIAIVRTDGSFVFALEGLVERIVDWTAEGLSWVAWGGNGGH